MSRHSKNNTANSIFSYYERKKVKGSSFLETLARPLFSFALSESGSVKGRCGEENLRKFEDCWLCLRPAVKPVCTPKGN